VPLSDLYHGFRRLSSSPVPTIAAVGSPVIGAGVNIPLACDVIVASTSARFDPRFLDVGLHPGGGHLWRLSHRIGGQGAAALVLCGDVLTGAEAAAVGLAWRCVDDSELDATATRLARRAAGRDAELVRRTKVSLLASLGAGEEQAVALELEAQTWSMNRPGFADGIRRLQERLHRPQ
jgi:enoyl-CoA hydratase